MGIRAGRLVTLITVGTALGTAAGGLAVFAVTYLVNRINEADQEHKEWNMEIAADIAGGIRMTPVEREVLREIEWAEAPAMDGRLDDVCDEHVFKDIDEEGGEESSSSG